MSKYKKSTTSVLRGFIFPPQVSDAENTRIKCGLQIHAFVRYKLNVKQNDT